MSWIDKIVEQKIQEAARRGELDDLPGKGRPLNLDENPFEPVDERVANRMLKQNGLAPAWLEEGGEIEREGRRLLSQLQHGSLLERKQAAKTLAEEIAVLNKRIFEYNLRAPLPEFHLRPLVLPPELGEV
jgi:DnaJ homolog subfamily C member 28